MTHASSTFPAEAAPRTRRKLRILLIEDNPRDAQLVAARMQDAGLVFELTRVQTHAAFNEALSGCQVDLVLSDYNVPGFDGMAALAAAHLACPDIPFLFVTSALGEEKAIEMLKKGATDYVLKDRLERLAPSVERALLEVQARQERRAAEAALRASEERLQRLIEASGAGTWEMDLGTGQVSADARLLALFGLPAGQPVQLEAVLNGIHPEDRERVRGAISAALTGKTDGRYAVEYRTVGPGDARVRWVEGRGQVFFSADGAPTRFMGTGIDITQRKEEEEARKNSEQQLRTITDALPVLVSFVDTGLRYRFVNHSYETWFGVERDAVVGRTVEELQGAAAMEVLRPWLDRALAGETVSFEGRVPYQRGGPRDIRATYVPHRGQDGAVEGLIILAADISEARRAEAELRARAEFEQQLIGIVSHDLRNPVNAIAVTAAMLHKLGVGERQAKAVSRIASSAERAGRMIRDLLDFTQARLGGGIPLKPAPTDLHAIARQVVEELQTSSPGLGFDVELRGDGTGEWDADRLAQVLDNLLGNAVKFRREGTPIQVAVHGAEEGVTLHVHNQGEPIPPELLPRLFAPLQRGVDSSRGERSIGLGLYIVDHIVRAHGGSVQVSSSWEAGTTFTVWLPRRPRA
jgi:PAS domain S-box-containing protein